MAKYTIESYRKKGTTILSKLPKNWKYKVGTTTAPNGFRWAWNGNSMFKPGYKSALIEIRAWCQIQNKKDKISFTREGLKFHDNITMNYDKERKVWTAIYGAVSKKPSYKQFKTKVAILKFAREYMKKN